MKKNFLYKKKHFTTLAKSLFWFFTGIFLGIFFCASFAFIIFQKQYSTAVYPGVMISGIDVGKKTEAEVETFFAEKNQRIAKTMFVFKSGDDAATVSAEQLDFGYNATLLAQQAYSVGRSDNIFSNITLVFQAYTNGINLAPSYHYSEEKLENALSGMKQKLHVEPVDALFSFENGRVTAFRPSSNGQDLDIATIETNLSTMLPLIMQTLKPQTISFSVPIIVVKPKVSTDQANSLGIKELIATGTSLFQHSIPNRVFNVTLAASRLNGVLVKPGETFSFGKALGDVSAFTGYKQAYVIQGGRTVLGDGGGVCQVSTTFFRALLNAGLPIIERHAHDYRVGYYEEDSPPGLDATVYVPSVDLRFKNDTPNHILIQTVVDPTTLRLTFYLYGTKDGRQVTLSAPVITNRSPAPQTLYQDDPTLPKGEIKQVDFAAAGATVTFTRQVTKDGKKIIDEKFVSNYRPWQAIFLRGTKE